MKAVFVCSILMILFITGVRSAAFTFASCNSSEELNPADLSCDTCGTNLIANNYQTVAIVCQCTTGFTSSTDGTCNALSFGPCGGTTYYPVYSLAGSSSTGTACVACDSTAYPNAYLVK